MGRPGTPLGWKAALCALAVAAAVGCGGGSSPTPPPAGPPTPASPGTPLGLAASALKIGVEGGTVTSSDGLFSVSIPAGAVTADVDVTVEVITNTAPSAVGNAYRIAAVPADTVFAAPIALVFTAPSDAALDTLTVATQDANGFWVRQQSVTRDPVAGTLTVTTTTLGDWAIVGAPTGRDLIGVFHVESTMGPVPVTADGKSSLNFHAGDATTGWYVQSGQLTAVSPLASGGQTCAPAAPTMQLAPNVAELLANPDRFRWAVDGHWELACASFPPLAYASFDTTGLNYLSCTRGYVETPLITPEKLLGRYVIDCGAGAAVTANWQFEICNLGEPCPSSNPCHTASITCDTGLPLCVDDGNVPNGLACDLVPGVNEVCGDGVCNVCRVGETCTPIDAVCHVGAYTCDTGFEVCSDTGAFLAPGTTCDVDPAASEVCSPAGTCIACTAGNACATNPNPCVAGTTSCATGVETCVDTAVAIAAGTSCGVNQVCTGPAGTPPATCIACTAGVSCATNANECVTGVTSCATGAETCENTTTAIANGTACDDLAGVPEVCFNGVCSACTAGTACTTNPNPCVAGVTSCTTGQEVCVDTTTPIANGTTCDVNPSVPEVCFNGLCNACTADLSCTSNPDPLCHTGVTSCTTGTSVCLDATALADGTACGTNMVCSGGACSFCEAGLLCTANTDPCLTGITSCATGSSQCVDNPAAPEPNGTVCGADQVCNGGACATCVAGAACADNSNPCVDGTTSCATGTSACVDTATVKPNGTTCDVDPSVPEVCNAGTCNACTAGLACASNPNPCVAGVTSCATGTQQCVDTSTALAAGTSCGVNQVCNGTGACSACTAGLACATNPNECVTGVTSCATGAELCVDTATAVANGTTCDENTSVPEVCLNGVCNACTSGASCTTNPDPLCNDGVTSCTTGTSVCLDGPARADGTSCGTNLVCSAGTCSACTAGLACSTNPDPLCNVGVTECSTGTSVCVDGPARTDGTSCGTNQVCSAGTCSACTAGLACTTNPDPLCNVGVTDCSTGQELCVDGAARADGTSCGTNLVCSAGTCSACTAGLACATNPDPCLGGVTSCATGASLCVDDPAAPEPNGTSCGTNLVCYAGACGTCTAGQACTTNPNPCFTGTSSCATGVETCVDATQLPAGTSCGTNLVCTASGACAACTAGLACATNPSPCLAGVTTCATGVEQCVDTATPLANGTACDVNASVPEVCLNGACNACTAGGACATNPNKCLVGVVSCASGTEQCVDTATPVTNGTSCGTDLVCLNGACGTCVQDAPCTTNPDPLCNLGVTDCSSGAAVCVDGAARADGTSCGTNQVCSGGTCSACTAGAACATNPDPCLTGITSCSTGVAVCVDNASAPEADGTSCGTNLVCAGGSCVACTAGLACTTNPNAACAAGVTSCATGAEACVDGAALPAGTSCGTNLVCSASATCVSCTAGLACATNPDPCLGGVTSCATGAETCVDDPLAREPDGTTCGTDRVCSGGVCSTCVAGGACTTNPTECVAGVISCATGAAVCVDSGSPLPNGTTCDVNASVPEVCSAGSCVACTAGLACTTNPNAACSAGVTSCASGVETCVDGAALPAGTSCGTNLVCSTAGACVSCVAGAACGTNPDPCLGGVTSCTTGTETCVDDATAAEPNGTVCGTDQVCNGGVCATCVAGGACTTNPTECVAGVTSCASGTPTCVDSATVIASGTTCDVDPSVPEVCSGGACVACTAGAACTTNPDPCLGGVTSCSTGTQTCVDDPAAPEANGTLCGTNYVCNAGACTSCTAGLACATNPNSCVAGTTSCATGTQTCVDTATPVANGTTCDVNPSVPEVCLNGTCNACTAGLACATNPNVCVAGTTSCATGTQTCVDTATAVPNGTSCGTNLVCNAGTCTSCTAGLACSTNPNVCVAGTTSCASGVSVCVDGTTLAANGTVCGTDQVCNGGTCTSCTAGVSCTTNPNPCLAGATSCATGAQTCADTTTRLANGTTCDVNPSVPEVCLDGTCSACTAGLACDTNPAPCLGGVTSCSTGTSVCVDDAAAPDPNGTPCDVDPSLAEVCSAGTCVACSAGEACTPSNPCHVGSTSCATGPTCTDTGALVTDGTTCGTGLSCSLGSCVSSRTVGGTRMATYWTSGAGCTAAAPCRSAVVAPDVIAGTAHVEALFPNGAGGWVHYPAAGPVAVAPDGSFSIPNVPTGAYRLVLYDGRGVAHVVDTSSSSVDLGYDVLGRADAALATLPTPVTFQLTGLTNWLGDDEVQATSFDADVWDAPVSGNEIVTNQTTGNVTEDWSASSVGRPLDLLSSGDVLNVHHLATGTVTVGTKANRVSYAYQRTTVAKALSGYALADGAAATLPVALAPVTSTGSVTVDWDPEQFEALLPLLGPSPIAATNAHRVDVETAPYASLSAAPVGAWGSPQLFRIVRAAGGATVLARITLPAITYGRFLDPALASEWWRADYTALQSYTAPGATTALQVAATVGRRGAMTSPLPAPIVPAIGPVRTPTLNGQNALAALPAVGQTPTLAWTAPATGAPTRYEVRVHRLVASGGATASELVATFRQTGTSLAVPPGILVAGETYYAAITPYAIASDRFDVAPLRLVQVFSHATTLTSPFSP